LSSSQTSWLGAFKADENQDNKNTKIRNCKNGPSSEVQSTWSPAHSEIDNVLYNE